MSTIDLIIEKIQALPAEKQAQVLDYVEFLMVKYQQTTSKKSAEQLAIERSKDLDDPDNPDKWITVIEAGDEIDIESSLENLSNRGYKVKIPSQSK